MRPKLLKKYMDCQFFYNNGQAYEFYKNYQKRPSLVFLPPRDIDIKNWYEREHKFYMTQEEFDGIWKLQEIYNKPWTFGEDGLLELKNKFKTEQYNAEFNKLFAELKE